MNTSRSHLLLSVSARTMRHTRVHCVRGEDALKPPCGEGDSNGGEEGASMSEETGETEICFRRSEASRICRVEWPAVAQFSVVVVGLKFLSNLSFNIGFRQGTNLVCNLIATYTFAGACSCAGNALSPVACICRVCARGRHLHMGREVSRDSTYHLISISQTAPLIIAVVGSGQQQPELLREWRVKSRCLAKSRHWHFFNVVVLSEFKRLENFESVASCETPYTPVLCTYATHFNFFY
ncbi:hypothetical protein GGX14DRAFT_389502 [Mycena pura]|uniref:Uncharacterized protein n=1 Tax=Mycena pura TaxID=153505 RepID=A0AAD6VQN8_9AGAR|nr:hypothetical protein GGX14DRAFT_389502 [Mycena pura]